jgi:hypothetical protein
VDFSSLRAGSGPTVDQDRTTYRKNLPARRRFRPDKLEVVYSTLCELHGALASVAIGGLGEWLKDVPVSTFGGLCRPKVALDQVVFSDKGRSVCYTCS